MMNGNDQHSSPTEADLSWFNGETNRPIVTLRRRKSWKVPLLLLITTTLLTGVVIAVMALTSNTSTCLTNDDYTALTGDTYAGKIDPTNNFYSDHVSFTQSAAEYADTSAQNLIARLSSFAKAHNKKSIIITIGATYTSPDRLALTQTRIDTVYNDLANAGVAKSMLQEDEPALVAPEEQEDSITTSDIVSIMVTSAESCK